MPNAVTHLKTRRGLSKLIIIDLTANYYGPLYIRDEFQFITIHEKKLEKDGRNSKRQ